MRDIVELREFMTGSLATGSVLFDSELADDTLVASLPEAHSGFSV
jgi:hypothetical protein